MLIFFYRLLRSWYNDSSACREHDQPDGFEDIRALAADRTERMLGSKQMQPHLRWCAAQRAPMLVPRWYDHVSDWRVLVSGLIDTASQQDVPATGEYLRTGLLHVRQPTVHSELISLRLRGRLRRPFRRRQLRVVEEPVPIAYVLMQIGRQMHSRVLCLRP